MLTLIQITSNADVEIAPKKIIKENDFKYEQSSNVCAVIIDKNSGRGYTQITKRDKAPEIIYTDRGDSNFVNVDIIADQTCILYGRFIILYIRPRSVQRSIHCLSLFIVYVIRFWHISLNILIDGDSFSSFEILITKNAYPFRYFSRKLRRSLSYRFIRYSGASSSDQPNLNY